MSVQLNVVLKRNKSNIKNFILKNKLTSYLALVEYCKGRNFIPCSEEEYKDAIPKVPIKEKKNERKNSNTQKKRKPGTSSKRKQPTQRILESDDNGKN
jgi:hypothetical protein